MHKGMNGEISELDLYQKEHAELDYCLAPHTEIKTSGSLTGQMWAAE